MTQMWIKGTYLVEEKLTKCWPHRFAPLFSLERFLMCIVLQCFSLEAKFLGSSKVIAMPSPTKWARWWSILNWPFMFWFFFIPVSWLHSHQTCITLLIWSSYHNHEPHLRIKILSDSEKHKKKIVKIIHTHIQLLYLLNL